ncbi:Ig-like domain-containing protein [Nocardioides zeicaulis]|uniref:Ig-like domain-containing protein n=1 Tax=Nocardioides zeicaulis TaxID=1776857 RepID=A0ABV6E2T1_9ACTN
MSILSARVPRALLSGGVALVAAVSTLALAPVAADAVTSASAIVADPGCTANSLPLNDDDSSGAIALASPLSFYDRTVTEAYVNNNGNITFDGPMYNFTGHISTLPRPLLAPFFADLETTWTGTPVTYGAVTWQGRPALCVNWHDVGFFASGGAPTNDFQVLLVDRSDVAAGDFDVVLDYGRIDGDYNGAAQVGFSAADHNPEHVFVLPGSQVAGAFLDSNPAGLVHGSRESDVLGRYVFRFRDGFPIGVTPPDTSITTGPVARSASSSPAFTYSTSSTEHRRFECRVTLQGQQPAGFATCPDAGTSFSGLADGTWTFEVRAVDAFYSTDASPASQVFTVDTTGPSTSLLTVPAVLGNDASPSFTWDSPDADAASSECHLDRPDSGEPSPWWDCADADDLGPLGDGDWTFSVRTTDDLGNTGDVTSYDFAIDTVSTGAAIVTGPARLGNDPRPTFTYAFDPSDDVASVECRVHGTGRAVWTPCDATSFESDELVDGDWTFEVRATDHAGNVGDSAAWDFTVDTVAPAVSITSGPRTPTNDSTPAFAFAATPSQDVDHFECALVPVGAQQVSPETCASGWTAAALEDGDHRFVVVAVDGAGNVSAPAQQDVTIDTVAPETTLTDAPPAVVGTGSVTFGYAADADGSTFECRLAAAGGTAAWGSCPSGSRTFTDLADGGHVFEVRATDPAGNTDTTPATGKVLVNVGRPTITATATGERPATSYGWFRSDVTITYACDGHGSAVVACPAPRVVPRAQQGRVVFRAVVRTADGDSTTTSTTLFIDKGRPQAEIVGFSGRRTYTSVPKPRCKASDPRSGLDYCTVQVRTVTRKDGRRFVVVKATATDKAGNVRVVRKQAPFRAA